MAFNRNWLSDWAKRVELTIDNNKIDTTVSGFPLLINLDGSDGITSVDIAQNIKDELGIPNDFSDTFTGADGDWDDNKWGRSQPGAGYIQIEDNKAKAYSITTGDNCYTHFNAANKWYINGSSWSIDFHFGYDSGDSDSTYWLIYATIRSKSDPGNHSQTMRFIYRPAVYGAGTPIRAQAANECNGVYTYGASTDFNATSFKARLYRSGTTLTNYYDIGGGWVEDLSMVCATMPNDCEIFILLYNYDPGGTTAVLWCDEIVRNSSSATYYYYKLKRIAVTESNGYTQLPVEVERFDHWNKSYVLWTKVPTITTSGTPYNKLYLYYDVDKDDNTSYIGDTGSAVGRSVWDDDYLAVYHLETGSNPTGAGEVLDSTANAEHNTGVNGTPNLITAKAGRGLNFDPGSSEYLNMNSLTSLNGISRFTFSCVVKSDEMPFTAHRGIFARGSTNQRTPWIWGSDTTSNVTCYFEMDDASVKSQSVTGLLVDTWHSIDFVWDNSYLTRFLDGVYQGSSNATTGNTMANDDGGRYIGYLPTYDYWDGPMDEIRISKIDRSDAYLKAQHYTIWDELITYGNEQNYPPMCIQGTVYDKNGLPMTESCNIIVSDLDGEFVVSDVSETNGTFNIGVPAPPEEKFIVTFYRQGHYRLDEDIAGAVFMTPASGTC